jgi:hypothetical protein
MLLRPKGYPIHIGRTRPRGSQKEQHSVHLDLIMGHTIRPAQKTRPDWPNQYNRQVHAIIFDSQGPQFFTQNLT